jgi:prepilin-type N-terminal cleavage/methylation domain-containing protein
MVTVGAVDSTPKAIMTSSLPSCRRAPSKLRGSPSFTLVEMLVVLAIIAIISAIAVPLIPSLMKSNTIDSNVQTLSGILEQARETAISGNTFVWVAFSDPPAASPGTGEWVAVFQSQDGTDPINQSGTGWTTTGITVPGTVGSTPIQLVGKLQNLPNVQITDFTNTMLSAVSNNMSSSGFYSSSQTITNLFEPSGMQWTITPLANTEGYSASKPYFTHAIQFTPDGEAHVQAWSSNVVFGLIPSTGTSTNNVVVLNISRLTGKTSVFRP